MTYTIISTFYPNTKKEPPSLGHSNGFEESGEVGSRLPAEDRIQTWYAHPFFSF